MDYELPDNILPGLKGWKLTKGTEVKVIKGHIAVIGAKVKAGWKKCKAEPINN